MRYWWLAFLILASIPLVHADTAGWYYAGDSFKIGDTVYAVEGGFSYDKVLLDVGGSSYVITLNDCVNTALAKYCYTNTAYPSDNAHIKYQAGHQYYGYYLTITTITPKIAVTRTISSTSPKIGDQVDVMVTIQNTGDVTMENITYAEEIPEGLSLVAGPGFETGAISYKIISLAPSRTENFRYTVRAEDYVSRNLVPVTSYFFANKMFNATVSPLSLFVVTPLEIKSSITPALNLDEHGDYMLNVTNKDAVYPMDISITLRLPEGLREGETTFTPGSNRTYGAKLTLKPQEQASRHLAFSGQVSGKYVLPVDLNISVGPATFKRHYEETVSAKSDKLVPSIKTSNSRTAFKPGDRLTVTAILENVNTVTTFRTISGTLSAPGLFDDETFSHEAFPPQRVLNEAEAVATMPSVDEPKSFTIHLGGEYATPAGEVYTFSTDKTITVNPAKNLVSVTRTVTPAKPGQNITVTVAIKNIYGEYISFNTHESYAPLVRVSGITYAEGSLDRDASKELYIYQLEVPANQTKSFNITTEVLVKGEDPVKFTTTVPVEAVVDTAAVPMAQETNTTATAVPEKKLGFFASIWDFFKNLI